MAMRVLALLATGGLILSRLRRGTGAKNWPQVIGSSRLPARRIKRPTEDASSAGI